MHSWSGPRSCSWQTGSWPDSWAPPSHHSPSAWTHDQDSSRQADRCWVVGEHDSRQTVTLVWLADPWNGQVSAQGHEQCSSGVGPKPGVLGAPGQLARCLPSLHSCVHGQHLVVAQQLGDVLSIVTQHVCGRTAGRSTVGAQQDAAQWQDARQHVSSGSGQGCQQDRGARHFRNKGHTWAAASNHNVLTTCSPL